MNKATIIEDAITYIQDLQMNVEVLQEQLFEMEASSEEEAKPGTEEETDAAEEMKKSGIQVYQLGLLISCLYVLSSLTNNFNGDFHFAVIRLRLKPPKLMRTNFG
jgi:hypothetical protein